MVKLGVLVADGEIPCSNNGADILTTNRQRFKSFSFSQKFNCLDFYFFRSNFYLYQAKTRASERKFSRGVRRSIPGPQILSGPPSVIRAHADKLFFVRRGVDLHLEVRG